MREIISLYIGQTGLQMGNSCWELFANEHKISTKGESMSSDAGSSAFFVKTPEGCIVPRAILVDSDPSVIEDIRTTEYGKLFPSDQIVAGKEDAANNWAKGYGEMHQFGETVMERIRRLSVECSSLQGIFVFHSSGGGIGSGLGSALLERLRDDFGKLPLFSVCAWPSPKLSATVVEPYNTVLSLQSQLDASTISVVLDNEALYDICRDQLLIESPTYNNLNQLISQTISSWTASLRFSGTLNIDMNEMATNLVPYPNLHFMLTSYAPILPIRANSKSNILPQFTAEQLTSSVFQPTSLFAKCNPANGYYVACSLMYRGDFAPREISNAIGQLKDRHGSVRFVDWCPTGYKYGMSSEPPSVVPNGHIGAMERSVSGVMNTTAIQEIFERIGDRFDAMYRKTAHLHWYLCEGISKEDFDHARERLKGLIHEYKRAEGVSGEKEEHFETMKNDRNTSRLSTGEEEEQDDVWDGCLSF